MQTSKAVAAANLRDFQLAGVMYQDDHEGNFWQYRQNDPGNQVNWWFGSEPWNSNQSAANGNRQLDESNGTLGSYMGKGHKVKGDAAFKMTGKTKKAVFVDTSYIPYAYNVTLGGGWNGNGDVLNRDTLSNPSKIAVFATGAQVDTSSPASPFNPMIEDAQGFDDKPTNKTIHFRLSGKALVIFADGHLEYVAPDPESLDARMPKARIGYLPVELVTGESENGNGNGGGNGGGNSGGNGNGNGGGN
ncbi:MAG: hypothetical protein SFY92_06690 [Verrucomicrobiae bacterium]|nr:hypothetical protein [Verrucomicrobiae bacterium]